MRWRTTLAGLLTLALLVVSPLTNACALHCNAQTQSCHQQSAEAPHCAMHAATQTSVAAATACPSQLCDQQATIQTIPTPTPTHDQIEPFVSVTVTLPVQHLDQANPASPPHLLTPLTLRTALRV